MALILGNKIIAGSFKTGASWEVGDVGISAFGIDEALNKRRYLNGQVISQAQFVQFTAFLKSRVSVYPSLATTEVNWQAAVTNSDLGQCGQFVIDDVAGTIRLPKVVNIQGLIDLTGLGTTVEAGLPNITGNYNGSQYRLSASAGNASSGALYPESASSSISTYQAGSATSTNSIGFDASRSSSIYGNSTTVQPEAVQYPYFIQVAEGIENSVDVSREIELNNPFTLFQYQWSSFILNNASWLRADTFSWQSGAVYVSAYEQLLTEYNAGTSETAEGITYRLTSTGKKIVLADQETAIASLYASTGKAWYYILDTENERFKLPRELPFDGQAKGNGMTLGLEGKYQGGTGYFGLNASGSGSTGLTASTGLYGKALGTSPTGPDWTPNSGAGVTTDATKSGIILNRDNTDSQKYLYFYVGETIQDANIIAAASVLTDVADLKAHSIVETYVNGTSWYRIYSDGWCEQGGQTSQISETVTLLKEMTDTNYSVSVTCKRGTAPTVSEGNSCGYASSTTQAFICSGAIGVGSFWEVRGYIS